MKKRDWKELKKIMKPNDVCECGHVKLPMHDAVSGWCQEIGCPCKQFKKQEDK